MPSEIEKYPNLEYAKPSEIIDRCTPRGDIDVFEFSTLSWADSERDVSAWLGNRMQKLSFERLKNIREYLGRYILSIKNNDKDKYISSDSIMEYRIYKNLQTSDNFYYQCIKGFNDMDVHSYFSHFETPYDAFATYLDVLYDFKNHLILSCVLDKYTKQVQRLKLNLEKKNIVSKYEDKNNNYTDENNNADENNTDNANSDDNHNTNRALNYNTNDNNKNDTINGEIVETAHNNEYSKNLKNKHNDILQKRIDDVLLRDNKEKNDKHKDDFIIGS
jgi:alpha-amylase